MDPKRLRKLERVMARGSARKVRLATPGARTEGEVAVRRWTAADRTRRALLALLAMWALGAVSIFIPVLHVVLVPAFLLIGPIAAVLLARQKSAVLGGRGRCPACGEPFFIEGGTERWPLDDVCESCRAAVTIEPV
ncbi:hypothetical protein GPROT1_03176 [Gammaproteobacteria bacterium]|nr:hypothetical protein GPROT1_03176 [Gammaproteobacteria bacterium]